MNIFPFDAFFNRNGISNILSLADISEKFRVTMDTNVSQSIVVHLNDHQSISFNKYGSGLYFYDTAVTVNDPDVNHYSFVTTVAANK